MRLVVADTSPIFYLLSIDQIDLLPQLFGTVFVPDAVFQELTHPAAPLALRSWAVQTPLWLQIATVRPLDDDSLSNLDAGERAAITLALSMKADLLLIDERKGTRTALSKGLDVTGTLGILRLAAMRGLVDPVDCFARLKLTSFRYRQETLDAILAEIGKPNDR